MFSASKKQKRTTAPGTTSQHFKSAQNLRRASGPFNQSLSALFAVFFQYARLVLSSVRRHLGHVAGLSGSQQQHRQCSRDRGFPGEVGWDVGATSSGRGNVRFRRSSSAQRSTGKNRTSRSEEHT